MAETAALTIGQHLRDKANNAQERLAAEAWADFFQRHRFDLGYYAIIPDRTFRYQDGNAGKTEAPTHFFDLDVALSALKGIDVKSAHVLATSLDSDAVNTLLQIPVNFAEARKLFESKLGPEKSLALGSVPWRVQQFFRLADRELAPVADLRGKYMRGAIAEGDAGRIFRGITLLGLLAHYSGDSTMPYHATQDFNGWETGQGGIHFFVENDCVEVMEPGLSSAVLHLANEQRKSWVKRWKAENEDPAQAMLRVLLDSAQGIRLLTQIDIKYMMLKPSKDGKFAVRKPPAQACGPLRPLLTSFLAKGAVLTAAIWARAIPLSIIPPTDPSRMDILQFSDIDTSPKYLLPTSAPGLVSSSN